MIKGCIKDTLPQHMTLKYVTENMASMPKSECDVISSSLGVFPYHLDCVDAVPMRRPRLCWTSEYLEDCIEGLSFAAETHWMRVEAVAPNQMSTWITPGAVWPGVGKCCPLPFGALCEPEHHQYLQASPVAMMTPRPDGRLILIAFHPINIKSIFFSGLTINGGWPIAVKKSFFWVGLVIRSCAGVRHK